MSYKHLITGLGAAALVAAPAAASAAQAPSHALMFQNTANTVTCGVSLTPGEIICSARGIPRPAHGGNVGDPFVSIKRTGKPQLFLSSQDDFKGTTPVTLGTGRTWSKDGVTCNVLGKKVTCTNASGHGFTIGNRKYKKF
jgi:hypothetical protein